MNAGPVKRLTGWARSPRREGDKLPLGATVGEVDEGALGARLGELGVDGELAARLDDAAEAELRSLRALSELTASLSLTYLERIGRPLAALDLDVGVYVVTRGYAAHLAVEADAAAYGATDIPVLGTLPRRRPPGDLLNRLVRVTRRGFETVRAVNDGVWDGFVVATTRRVHQRGPAGTDEGHLDPVVIDGLLRFGWVLRQVDLHYGLQPDRG